MIYDSRSISKEPSPKLVLKRKLVNLTPSGQDIVDKIILWHFFKRRQVPPYWIKKRDLRPKAHK